MPRGGKRAGAGRKPGLQAEAYRKALIDLIEANKDGLAKALIDKGLAGDVPALKEINERALGKVPQPLAGDPDNPLIPETDPETRAMVKAALNAYINRDNPGKGQPA